MNNNFWKRQIRQFTELVTTRQVIFEFVFGIVLPVLCLIFDPFIFRSIFDIEEHIGGGSEYQVFVYTAVGIGILSLGCWLRWGHKFKEQQSGLLAGIFFADFLFASGLAIFLLPYSIVGLFCIFGIFGFIPFVTAYVFLRNGVRALRRARQNNSWSKVSQFAMLGVLLGLGIPALFQWQAKQYVASSVSQIMQGDNSAAKNAVQRLKILDGIFPQFTRKQLAYNPTLLVATMRIIEDESQAIDEVKQKLKYLSWCKICFDRLPCTYDGKYSPTPPSVEQKKFIANVYQELMGESIDKRAGMVLGMGPSGSDLCLY